jgi:hypothetical protein
LALFALLALLTLCQAHFGLFSNHALWQATWQQA